MRVFPPEARKYPLPPLYIQRINTSTNYGAGCAWSTSGAGPPPYSPPLMAACNGNLSPAPHASQFRLNVIAPPSPRPLTHAAWGEGGGGVETYIFSKLVLH